MQEVTRRRPKPNPGAPLPQMTLLLLTPRQLAWSNFGSAPDANKSQRPASFAPTCPPPPPSRTSDVVTHNLARTYVPNQTMSARALLLTTATLLLLVAAARAGQPLAGGWSPIRNVSDPHIQELGGWAVTEHVRRANDGLRFGEVTGGEEQVVSGMNYKLVLDATDADGKVAAYGAFVYEQSWTNTRELVSFAPAS